ncbi:MAG: leucyl-tRNA--protein transferase [Treponema sp.]|nr:leucyl-tRNA--protein transferase [Treponema sp.]
MIRPWDDPEDIVDAMLAADYGEEFCLVLDFDPGFVAALMKAGFLIMSVSMDGGPEMGEQHILLPKLHLERSVLLFPQLRVKRSIRGKLSRYELRVDGRPAEKLTSMEALFSLPRSPASDFDIVMERCVAAHDDDWLTVPLRNVLREIRSRPWLPARPLSFGVYRDGVLRAGEFGVLAGKVYTSYSGYYDEDNAGSVQMILTARYLEKLGAPFWDLGMPLNYKTGLGAQNVDPFQFVELFRKGRL